MDEKHFPSNSIKSRKDPPEEKPEIKKVISGEVKTKKKGLGRKLKETFLSTTLPDVVDYLVNDVIIPAAQYTVVDSVKRGIEMLILGSASPSDDYRRSRGRISILGGGYDYNSISRRNSTPNAIPRNRIQISKYHGNLNDDDMLFESIADAREAWSWLRNIAEDYDKASLADYYQLIGRTPDTPDFDYGWWFEDYGDIIGLKNIDVNKIICRCPEGYLLDLPRCTYIKN